MSFTMRPLRSVIFGCTSSLTEGLQALERHRLILPHEARVGDPLL